MPADHGPMAGRDVRAGWWCKCCVGELHTTRSEQNRRWRVDEDVAEHGVPDRSGVELVRFVTAPESGYTDV